MCSWQVSRDFNQSVSPDSKKNPTKENRTQSTESKQRLIERCCNAHISRAVVFSATVNVKNSEYAKKTQTHVSASQNSSHPFNVHAASKRQCFLRRCFKTFKTPVQGFGWKHAMVWMAKSQVNRLSILTILLKLLKKWFIHTKVR